MTKNRPEPTQGRSIPDRLKHIEKGVSNWGKRWTKGKKGSSGAPLGGEYNTFPVAGTTNEFSISTFSASPAPSDAETEVSGSESSTTLSSQSTIPGVYHGARSTSITRKPPTGGVVKPSRPRRKLAGTPTITIDPCYGPNFHHTSQAPCRYTPSPTTSSPHTPSSRPSPLTESSASSSPSWESRGSPEFLYPPGSSSGPSWNTTMGSGNAYSGAQDTSLSLPSTETCKQDFGVYGSTNYMQEAAISNGTLGQWSTGSYAPTYLPSSMLEVTNPANSYAQGSYSPAYLSSVSDTDVHGRWKGPYGTPPAVEVWAPAPATPSPTRTTPSPQQLSAGHPSQGNQATHSALYAPAYVTHVPAQLSVPSPSSHTSPRTVAPSTGRAAKHSQTSPASQHPYYAPTYHQTYAPPQVPPVHSVGGYSAALGYAAPMPPPLPPAQRYAGAGVSARVEGQPAYAQAANGCYAQPQAGQTSDPRFVQNPAAYHPYRR